MKNDTIKKLTEKELIELLQNSPLEETPQIYDELIRRNRQSIEKLRKDIEKRAKANIRKHTRAGK